MFQSDYALKVEIMYIERFWIIEGATKVPRSQKEKQTREELASSRLSDSTADA